MNTSASNVQVLADATAVASLTAFESLAKADVQRAAKIWTEAADRKLAAVCASNVLVYANGALGHLLLGEAARAVDRLDLAHALLADVAAAARADTHIPGTSTAHHVRLASRHGDAFANAAAARGTELRAAIQALVTYHRSLAASAECRPRDLADVRDALTRAFGRSSPDVALMTATGGVAIASCYALKATRLERLLATPAAWGRQGTELLASAAGVVTPALLDLTRELRGTAAPRREP